MYLHFEVRLFRISHVERRITDTKISFHDNSFKITGVVVTSIFFSLMYLFSWCLPSLTFVSSILAHGEVSSIQHYVIQFVYFSQHTVGFVYGGSLDYFIRKQNYCWKCLMSPTFIIIKSQNYKYDTIWACNYFTITTRIMNILVMLIVTTTRSLTLHCRTASLRVYLQLCLSGPVDPNNILKTVSCI